MFIKINNLSKIYNQYLAVNKINFQIDSIKDMSSVSPRSVLGCYHNLDLKIRSSMEEN